MKNVEELREAADVYEHGWFFSFSLNAVSYIYLVVLQCGL